MGFKAIVIGVSMKGMLGMPWMVADAGSKWHLQLLHYVIGRSYV